MNNNDIFKKLRVALQLRDDQIVEILQLVDFRISTAELGAFFRSADHPKYMDCGDQVLRNFLNGLVIHLRGTKENPKVPMDVLNKNKAAIATQPKTFDKPKAVSKPTVNPSENPKKKFVPKKDSPKVHITQKVKYNNGKNKKS